MQALQAMLMNDRKQTAQRLKLQERLLTINKRNIIRWNIYRDKNFHSRRQVYFSQRWTRGKKIAQSFLSTAKCTTNILRNVFFYLRWENISKGFLKFFKQCKLISNLLLGQIIVWNLTKVHKLAAETVLDFIKSWITEHSW